MKQIEIARFCIKTVALGLLLVLSIAFLSSQDNTDVNTNPNLNIRRIQCFKALDTVDLAILGNSYGYSGINNRLIDSLLGLSSYNISVATAGPVMYRIILDDFLRTCSIGENFRLGVVISPTTFSSLSDNFSVYPIHRYLNHPLSDFSLVLHKGGSLGIPYFRKKLNRSIKNVLTQNTAVAETCGNLKNRGFFSSEVLFTDSIRKSSKHLYSGFTEHGFQSHKEEEFQNFLNYCSQLGLDIFLIELPTNQLDNFLDSDFKDSYKEFTDKLRTQHRYVDLTTLELNSQYYRNIDHLNKNGADRLTELLIGKIEN